MLFIIIDIDNICGYFFSEGRNYFQRLNTLERYYKYNR